MELLDIIVSSLKIFCSTMLTVVAVSYLFYKIKNRNKVKPYLRNLKDQTSTIKITYQKPETDKSRFERLDNINMEGLSQISINSVQSRKKLSNSKKAKIIRYFPGDNNDRSVKQFGNLNILDLYSADSREKMYKISS